MTNKFSTTGGVVKPISSRAIMMMPNHTASIPNATTSGEG